MQLEQNTLTHEGVHFNATFMNGTYDVVVDGNYAYATNYNRDNVAIVKDGDYLYVASNVSDALQIIDVSNPTTPSPV